MGLKVFKVLILRSWTWDVLCWGDQLSADVADVLRHSPSFWKRHSHLQFPLHLSGRWRRWWTGQQINSPGFIFRMEIFLQGRGPVYEPWLALRLKSILVCCGVRCFPTVECAYIHWGRRYRWWFWGLRWLRAIIVVIAIHWMAYHRNCCQVVKWIERQVQIVQAQGNDWELPSESISHCWHVRVVVKSKDLRFWGCNRGNWGHSCCMGVRYFSWVEDIRRIVPLRSGLIGYLFHKEHISIHRINRNIGGHVEFREKIE